MGIFDEPSKSPLPQPTFDDVQQAGRKGLVSIVPLVGGVASELLGLLSSPVAQRRDDWFVDLERRLRDLEGRIEGFRFDDLEQNEQFVSATLQATQAALRTQQKEKLEALRNAVLNVAAAKGNLPSDDRQLTFLNLIDRFTPTHLQMLSQIEDRVGTPKPQSGLNNQVVQDLNSQGLLMDSRPYAARNRDDPDLLTSGNWWREHPWAPVSGVHQISCGGKAVTKSNRFPVSPVGFGLFTLACSPVPKRPPLACSSHF